MRSVLVRAALSVRHCWCVLCSQVGFATLLGCKYVSMLMTIVLLLASACKYLVEPQLFATAKASIGATPMLVRADKISGGYFAT